MKTLWALSLAAALWAQDARPRPAIPVDPVGAIVDAFTSHQLVALDDPHGNVQVNAVRLSLIRDPRFAATVNDIVVEFGNARYQDRMDRFVRGEDVAEDALRDVWQNTTAVNIGWDRPIYEEFFRAVRAVNASLPPARRLRVLLGDPPIDWSAVRTTDDLTKWMNVRDTHAADLIRREVLEKRRRALVIYGGGHFPRIDPGTLVSLVEKAGDTRVFTVWTDTDTNLPALQADISAWTAPTFVLLRDTVLGAAPFTTFFPVRGVLSLRMEDQFDALLYLGPRPSLTTSPLAPARCADTAYMEMRTSRMKLFPPPPGAPDPVEQLKRYCAAQSPARPSFDAASIKPSDSSSSGPSVRTSGNRVVATSATLRQLVQFAYRTAGGRPFLLGQIAGSPRWAEADRFDVQATAGASAGEVPERTLRLMTQSLLETRFQLRTHREMRELPVYDLVAARGGIKTKHSADQTPVPEADTDGRSPVMQPGTLPRGRFRMIGKPSPSGAITLAIIGSAITVPTFVNVLQQYVDRPIVDSTGAVGLYDVQVEFGLSQQQPGVEDVGASLFTALQEQLGLKLDAVKRQVEVLVIDQVERPAPD